MIQLNVSRALRPALVAAALGALVTAGGCGFLFERRSTPTTTTTTTTTPPSAAATFTQLPGHGVGWRCAREHERCVFTGEATVVYGADTRWASKRVSGPVACENSVFGDPAVGIVKTCYVRFDKQVGACRGAGWNAGGWPRAKGAQTAAGCATLCMKTAGCTAFDIARPTGDRYDCWLFGHGDVAGNGGHERCYVRGGTVAPPPPPPPTRDPARAKQLNDEGKRLWLQQNDLAAAIRKFRQATELDPDPTYFFNLCYASHQLGRWADARAACEETVRRTDDDKLRQKAQVVLDDVSKRGH